MGLLLGRGWVPEQLEGRGRRDVLIFLFSRSPFFAGCWWVDWL